MKPRHSQDAAPIADAMRSYWESGMLSFSIPAHGGGRGPAPEFTRWAGEAAARFDLPMTHGVDTRDAAREVTATARQLFAEAVGAKQTLFSTNGSSLSVHVAMLTVAGPGRPLVLSRNAHKSEMAGLVLSGSRPVYLEPTYDEELELALDPRVADLQRLLDGAEADAVMVVTPSYYGTSAAIGGLADVCHGRDLPLVTDDAWGLDYGLCGHPDLPRGALEQGADLAIGSVHKTLTGLTQTSVLSVGSDRIDTERLGLCFELEESTSVSALLLSSIDGARRQFVRDGAELLSRAVDSANLLRERLASEVPELRVIGLDELREKPGVAAVDTTHVLIETAPAGLTCYEADDWLRDERQIDVELADHRRIMPLITFAHGEAEIDRLVRGLRDLVDQQGSDKDVARFPTGGGLRTEQVMTPRDAFFAPPETVSLQRAAGRISAELVTPYPPGIPVVAPGEVYTEQLVGYLGDFIEAGGFVEGAIDPSLETLRVVA